MTDNHFRSHFSPFQINMQLFFLHKMAAAAILNDRKSLSIAFLAISDQYAIYFFKMAAGSHFESPIWAILDDRKSLSIPFLAISDKYATSLFIYFFKWPPAAILEVRFAPKNNRVLPLCVINGYSKYEVDR